MPSLGSMVRARWSALLGDSPLLHTAFSLESVADETIFVIGPAVVTLLATEVYPAAGVAVAMVACVTGTLLFAAQRRTEPPARQRARCRGRSAAPGSGIPAPGLLTLAPVYFCLGAMFAAIDLSTVDFAQEHGHKPLAGFILGAYALGSAVGGALLRVPDLARPGAPQVRDHAVPGHRRDRDLLGDAGPDRAGRWSSSAPAWPSRRPSSPATA